ncbi:MAG: hypothetical protein LUQ38_01845 [Methanotrichaceae archaeon]|nr:hypothetical protein [Methanotrichaceae archaeon]MDD1758192.1 hypothetical protein [Methanotrichaceae archaeon]
MLEKLPVIKNLEPMFSQVTVEHGHEMLSRSHQDVKDLFLRGYCGMITRGPYLGALDKTLECME